MPSPKQRISVIDSHTGGEPTRVIIAGGPDLGTGTVKDQLAEFRGHFDDFGAALVNEPRGSDVIVGAMLVSPSDPRCVSGVIYFDNVGCIGMCGHGSIGTAVTLGHLGRITAGKHYLETAVGVISFEYDGANTVEIENVPAYRYAKGVTIDVPDYGRVTGDIAWGGNWFFQVNEHQEQLTLANVDRLTDVTRRIRKALEAAQITGKDGGLIDHIILYGPPGDAKNHSRNFVLCPGMAYDRSPCGTGTSAKLACLYADGLLKPGQIWRQESLLGSLFEGSVRIVDGTIIPRIRGTAYITAEATVIIDPADPFARGIRK